MSGINLSDILGNIEEHFPEYSDCLEIEIDDKVFSVEESLEDAQKEIEEKDNINCLSFSHPEGYILSYYRELDWTIECFDIFISRNGEKGYRLATEIFITANEANDKVSEYSDRDDFEDVVNKIWDELKKEGHPFATHFQASFLELDGDYSHNWEYAETIEETLKQVYGFLEYLVNALATVEEYYSRLISHYEKEDE